VGIAELELDCFLGADCGTATADTANLTDNRPAALHLDGIDVAFGHAGATTDTVIADLHRETFHPRLNAIHNFGRYAAAEAGDAAALAAKTNGQKLALIRDHEDVIIKPGFSRDRDEPGFDGFSHMSLGLLDAYLAANLARNLQG